MLLPRTRSKLAFSAFAAVFALFCALLVGGSQRSAEPRQSFASVSVALRAGSPSVDRADERSATSTAVKRSTALPAVDLPTPLGLPARESREIEISCAPGAGSQPVRGARRGLPEARAPPRFIRLPA